MLIFQRADELMVYSTARFVKEQVDNLNDTVDEIQFEELYNKISYLVGESMIDELNEKLKQRFLIVPLVAIFAQGMNNDLLYKLTTHDYETSKQMFQLLLDILPDSL